MGMAVVNFHHYIHDIWLNSYSVERILSIVFIDFCTWLLHVQTSHIVLVHAHRNGQLL